MPAQSTGAAREQLRIEYARRFQAREDLEAAIVRHENAVEDLGVVTEQKRDAGNEVIRLAELRAQTKLNSDADIAELRGLIEEIEKDRQRSRRMADAAHLRGDYRMRDKHNAEARGFAEEARPYRKELRPFIQANEEADAAVKAAQLAVDALVRTQKAASQELADARTCREQCEQAVFEAEVAYAHADAAFGAAQEAERKARDRKRHEWRRLAERAGVPSAYLDRIRVKEGDDGLIQIYFGGIGSPDGENHGHYTVGPTGKVIYRRDPYRPHGAHNFIPTPSPA